MSRTTMSNNIVYVQYISVTEPPRKGVRRHDQLKRFSVKREHNHTHKYNTILYIQV
jgi:hypothetical protein